MSSLSVAKKSNEKLILNKKQDRLQFGSYKGYQVSELPDNYLAWLSTEKDLGGIEKLARDEMRKRKISRSNKK